MTMNGTASMISLVQALAGGRYRWMSEVATPISSPTATAIGRLRSLAAMTAANDAAMSRVKLTASSPMIGAASTPVSPARKVLTAHTPIEMAVGIGAGQIGHGRGVDHRPHLEADVAVPQHQGPGHHDDHDADVHDDLVEGDRHPEEVEHLDRLGSQARCLLDGRAPEDQGGERRKGDREPDGRHHLGQRGGQLEVAEQDGVQQHPEGGGGDRRWRRTPAATMLQPCWVWR